MARRQPNAKEEYLRVTSQLPPDVAEVVQSRATTDRISFSAAVVAILRGEINSADKRLAQACRNFVSAAITSSNEEKKLLAADVLKDEILRIVATEIGGAARRYDPTPATDSQLAAEAPPAVQSARREIQAAKEKSPPAKP